MWIKTDQQEHTTRPDWLKLNTSDVSGTSTGLWKKSSAEPKARPFWLKHHLPASSTKAESSIRSTVKSTMNDSEGDPNKSDDADTFFDAETGLEAEERLEAEKRLGAEKGRSRTGWTSRFSSYLPSAATAATALAASLVIAGAAAAYYHLGQDTQDPTDLYSAASSAIPEDSTPAASGLFSAFSEYTGKFAQSVRDRASSASAATGDMASTGRSGWSVPDDMSSAFSAVGDYAGHIGSSIWTGVTGTVRKVAMLGPGMSDGFLD